MWKSASIKWKTHPFPKFKLTVSQCSLLKGRALQAAFWGSCAHASLQKRAGQLAGSHLSHQLPEWCPMDQDILPVKSLWSGFHCHTDDGSISYFSCSQRCFCYWRFCGAFSLTEFNFAIECILCGAFSNFSPASDGLGKLRSEISQGPPELRGQRAPGVFDEDRNTDCSLRTGEAELIIICAAALCLKWVMNMLVEDKPWLKLCCCGRTLGRKPQGVGYGISSIRQAYEQELQGATSAGRSWLSLLKNSCFRIKHRHRCHSPVVWGCWFFLSLFSIASFEWLFKWYAWFRLQSLIVSREMELSLAGNATGCLQEPVCECAAGAGK